MKYEVAQTIHEQMNGQKFLAMTGSKIKQAGENYLVYTLTTNQTKAKFLKIELTAMDDYTMTFFNVDMTKGLVVKAEVKGVLCDTLQFMFTYQTGLDTKL